MTSASGGALNDDLVHENADEAEDEDECEFDGLARPDNRFRGFCWDIATHTSFDTTILLCICANVGVRACRVVCVALGLVH